MEIKNICVLASAAEPSLELNELDLDLLGFCGFARVFLNSGKPT